MRIVMFTLLVVASVTGLGLSIAFAVIGIHMILQPFIHILEAR